jgi:hypothetical protein
MVELRRETETHFSKSLLEITGDVFISSKDSEEDRARKQSGGFYVFEDKTWNMNQIPKQLESESGIEKVSAWLKSPRNFHSLIQLVATDNPILKKHFITEEELRRTLCDGALAEASALESSFKDATENEDPKRWIFGSSLKISDAPGRIEGLKKFQKELFAQEH